MSKIRSEKTDFYKLLSAHRKFESMLVFDWFQWRQDRGLEWQPEGKYTVKYDYETDDIVAKSSFGEDRYPANLIYGTKDPVIEMLWHDDYYDGPLSGMALYKGQYVYYKINQWEYDELIDIRTFYLYKLSHDEIKDELQWHVRFTKEVENQHHKSSKAKKFYKDREKRKDPEYSKNECLGEFDECLFTKSYDKTVEL